MRGLCCRAGKLLQALGATIIDRSSHPPLVVEPAATSRPPSLISPLPCTRHSSVEYSRRRLPVRMPRTVIEDRTTCAAGFLPPQGISTPRVILHPISPFTHVCCPATPHCLNRIHASYQRHINAHTTSCMQSPAVTAQTIWLNHTFAPHLILSDVEASTTTTITHASLPYSAFSPASLPPNSTPRMVHSL